MTGADILDVSRDGIVTFLKVASPLMLIALVQALTQIQEQTLVFVPKIIAIFITMLIALPFMGSTMSNYMTRLADMIVTGG